MSQREGLPWLTIAAVTVILALTATIFIVVLNARQDKNQAAAAEQAIVDALAPWQPSTENPDPSTKIPDIFVGEEATYKVGLHVTPPTRVAYDRYPPVGGPHDAEWAACNGVVYGVAVRNENMVHTLEHGAIWITYNPDTITAGDLDILKALVTGRQYITLSPYPGLPSKISLQAWRHQLMVDSASDERVRQFMTALQQNPNTTPEINGTCEQPTFDVANPPAFDASTPGPDAVQMDGTGGAAGAVATQDSAELMTGETAPQTTLSESGSAIETSAGDTAAVVPDTGAAEVPDTGAADTATAPSTDAPTE